MIDRHARDVAADVLQRFKDGAISNKEYEKKYPTSKVDPALSQIWTQVWFFYSDVKTHVLAGKDALDEERSALVERCILFLRSNEEFQWPRQKFHPWYLVLRVLGLTRTLENREQKDMSVGDKAVWPFINRSQYEATISQR